MRYTTLLTVVVEHAFFGPSGGCPPIELGLLDPTLAARHRLFVRARPGRLRLLAEADGSGRPLFDVPRPGGIDLALSARDSIVETITGWPEHARVEAPTGLGGVRRRSVPLWLRGGHDAGPVAAFATRGVVRWTPIGRGPHAFEVRGADGRPLERRSLPTGCAAEQLFAPPTAGGHWSLVVDGSPLRLYTGPLPARCMGLVRVGLQPGAGAVAATVSLPTREAVWTYRIVACGGGPKAAEGPPYRIVDLGRPPVATFGPPRDGSAGVEIASTAPLPLRADPIGPLQLTRTDTRSVLVERLPTPSPRAPSAAVDIYL